MSYADDLAKDRDNYRRQRDKLADLLQRVMDNPTPKQLHLARVVLKQIYDAEPTAEKLLGNLANRPPWRVTDRLLISS